MFLPPATLNLTRLQYLNVLLQVWGVLSSDLDGEPLSFLGTTSDK